MRTVNTGGGPVEVRSLTNDEIRNGKDVGMRYLTSGVTAENFEDHRDYCLGCLFGDGGIPAGMSNAEQNIIFSALLKETWGDPGEEKNLSTSGLQDQTSTESTIAKHAEKTSDKGN